VAVQAQETRLAVWRVMIESRRALTLREIQQRVGHQDGVRLHLRHFAAAGLVRYENLIDRWRVMCDPVKRALVTRQLERKLQGPGGAFDQRIERARVLYLRLKLKC